MDTPKESVADILRQAREMHVEELSLASIDTFAEVRVGLIRRAETDGFGACESAIERAAGRCPGDDIDFERPPCSVLRLRADGNGAGDGLGRSSGRKTAHSDGLAIFK